MIPDKLSQSPPLPQLRVAIVTDWLTNMGGSERVVLKLHDMFPTAPIYTSIYDPQRLPLFKSADIRTSWMQKLPPRLRRHQLLTIPRQWYFGRLKLKGYDLIISASGAEAKATRAPEGRHIAYCYTPTQYYWVKTREYLSRDSVGKLSGIYRTGLKVLLPFARRWDYGASKRPTAFIAISNTVRSRIKKIYRRNSVVIFPPVETARFSPTSQPAKPHSRKSRNGFVIAGRQVHHKRFDLAIRACNELSLPLTVIGNGPMHAQLRRIAGPTITFKTDVTDEQMPRFFQEASGFIFPNEEDFGIVAVEAMAAGCPVIAFRAGGSLDIVKENISGVFFDEQSVECLKRTIGDFQKRHFSEDRIIAHAKEFDGSVFETKMREYIFRHIS